MDCGFPSPERTPAVRPATGLRPGNCRHTQEAQHDIVRDGQEPLDQWQVAIQLPRGIGIGISRETACSSSVEEYSARSSAR
jgi:hypothetical protein